MLKKMLIGLVAVVVIVLALGGYLWSNMDSIVKAAIEKYGSEAAQTRVELASVSLSPTSGMGKITGLRLQNPAGFKADDAFSLGMIEVQMDMESIAGDDPIVISTIMIDRPTVTFEVNEMGRSNLQAITRNAQNYAAKNKASASSKNEAKTTEEQERKLIIKKLIVSGGKVIASQTLLGDKKLEANIPTFTLRDLGSDQGGMMASDLAAKLVSEIGEKASEAASKNFMNDLKSIPDSLKESVPDSMKAPIGDGVDAVKGLFE